MKLERNVDNFGRELWAWSVWGGPKPWRNKADTFEKQKRNSLGEFTEKFGGNFPKLCQTQRRKSTQIRSAEPRNQNITIKMRGVSRYFPKVSGSGVDVTLLSRLSFPATGPPDPGRVSEGFPKGSEGVSERVSEGFLKGFRRVLEGVSRGPLLKSF